MAFLGRNKSRANSGRRARGDGKSRSVQRQETKSERRKRRSRRRRNKPVIFILLSWFMTLGLWLAIIMAATTAYVFVGLDKQGLFKIPNREPGMMLLSADGHVVAESGSFFGDEARVAELPRYLPQAVIAIEDRRFRSHFGIDFQGLVRASVANYRAKRIVQGGSTITQQLAKNLFLKPERTYQRKFQEAVLALWLESKYSKDEILQLYLNRVYFGAGAFGVEKAAQKYFGKSARAVSIPEAAMLAGLLKAPSTLNPLRNPKKAEARAKEVIKDMLEIGFVTEEDLEQAGRVVKTVKPADYIPATQYIVDWVGDQLPDLIGRFDQSIVVETTLDRSLQALAEKTVTRTLNKRGRKLKVSQGAMVVMDTTGGVRAMVGGKSYIKSQFNRAVSAKRQPGSSFKPFVYLTAIEFGMSPDSVEYDEPLEIDGWKPHNYSNRYYGAITLRQALSKSLNTVAVRLGQSVGPRAVVTTAHRMGINSELTANASIPLGTSEVTLLELTSAYAPFSNGGNAVVPHVVKRITTREGKVLYERRGDGLGSVVSSYDLGAMNDMLRSVVKQGTGTKARLKGQDVGGKTGTSQDYRDAWFIGYSSHLVAGVWVGNDDNSPTNRVTGGSLPATMWRTVMTEAHSGLPKVDLPGEATLYGQDEIPMANDNGGFIDILQDMFGNRQNTELDTSAPRDTSAKKEKRRERLRKRLKELEDSR